MTKLQKIKENPVKVMTILTVLLFWMLVPLFAQKYFKYSAINVSFAITVFYFIFWKIHERKDKLKELLG